MGMDSSSAQHHHQEMNCSSQTLESMLVMTTKTTQHQQQENKKPRPADMDSLNCPRCDSTNTKFCYYNNYSLSQPRYFCKSCRRYWTKGGTLRNVPVGGGCRKNKRPSSSSSSCSSASSKQQRSQDHHPTMTIPSLISGGSNPLSSSSYDSNDLTLAIARLQSQDYNDFSIWGNPNTPHHHHQQHHHSDGFDLETPPNGIENFYYGNVGMENGGLGMGMGIEMGMGIGMSEEMGIPFEEFTTAISTSTAVKQEICGGGGGTREGTESTKVLFGFPWQTIGGGGGNSNNNNSMGEFDSGRSLSWNGISNGSSNWHGLLNSPLM